MTEVVVIGGGIIGASVTYRLALAGPRVTMLEANTLGSGTSGSSFAWINSNDKPPLEYHQLNTGGMAEHALLHQEFGTAPWLHLGGNVEWADDEAGHTELRAKVDRLRSFGYQVELLTTAELRALEPDLAPPPNVEEAAFYPTEGYVDAPLLIGALTQAARLAGAQIHTDSRVTEIVREAGRAAGVVTADGTRFSADVVVSCVGRWTNQLSDLAGIDVPMAPTIGLLAISAPSPIRLKAIVHSPSVNLRPDGAGRVMMRGGTFDRMVQADTPTVPLPGPCNDILEQATQLLPALAGIGLEAARIGVRAIPSDGYPVIGPVPDWDGFYLVCTHSGVTMAPLLGRVVAKEIMTGAAEPRLSPYRPERLVATGTPA